MRIHTEFKTYNFKMNNNRWTYIDEDIITAIEINNSFFDIFHKMYSNHLANDRKTFIEFDYLFRNVFLHVIGFINDSKFYYSERFDVELDLEEKQFLRRQLNILSEFNI